MSADWLPALSAHPDNDAAVEGGTLWRYRELVAAITARAARLEQAGVGRHDVVVLHSDFSLTGIATFFALAHRRAVIIPMVHPTVGGLAAAREDCGARFICQPGTELQVDALASSPGPAPALYGSLRERGAAGLVLLSSGSTGRPKAILHDLDRLIGARLGRRSSSRLSIILVLLFDHIGGINTMLNTLFSGGLAVIAPERSPEAVCELVARHRVRVLPASPTFLNLILMGGFHRRYDLRSLRLITYGTEPMPDELLRRLREAFPKVRLLQTFGTSETGIAGTTSQSSSSTFFRIDDPEVTHRIVDGELQLRSSTQFLGYLNTTTDALTEDGWFRTGDLVEATEDGFIRIRGRANDVINVGGEKVLPLEVETALLQSPLIADCVVYGEPNAITGQAVCADIQPSRPVTRSELRRHVQEFLAGRIDRFKVPSRITLVAEVARSERFKKLRSRP